MTVLLLHVYHMCCWLLLRLKWVLKWAYIHFHYNWEIFHYGNRSRCNFIYLEYSPVRCIRYSTATTVWYNISVSLTVTWRWQDFIASQPASQPSGIRSYLTTALGNSKSEKEVQSAVAAATELHQVFLTLQDTKSWKRERSKSLRLSLFLEPAFRRVIIPLQKRNA
jgi:hypothetical protein